MKTIIPAMLIGFSLTLLPIQSSAQSSSNEVKIQEVLGQLLTALNNLDWEEFQTPFSENASIFSFNSSFAGRKDVQSSMFQNLPEIRANRPGEPPYTNLMPLDLEIEIFGDAALATFHLTIPVAIGQRTVFLIKENDAWKIHHLHASNVNKE